MGGPLRNILADPAVAFYYVQKGLRIVALREALSAVVAWFVRLAAPRVPEPATPAARRYVSELESTGFAGMPEKKLNADQLAQALAHFSDRPLLNYYGSGEVYPSVAQGVAPSLVKAVYSIKDVAACKPLMDLANDPDILAAVAQRLGATPTIGTVGAWWTFGENNTNSESAVDDIYHRDVDDLRFVKIFLYLTDADVRTGAHRFVMGSHADTRFARRGPITDSDVEAAYGADKLLTVTGTAGTSFLEETWGIHRALLATEGRRLIFSAIYVLSAKLPFGPARPLLPLPEGYDRYINRRLYD